MAHPFPLTPRLVQERDDTVVRRSPFKAHVTFGARADHTHPAVRCPRTDLGHRRGQVLALLRACGLRFRDGSRWRLPAMIQLF
ncbi:hypothetical protein [Micromonospora sp. NPDC049102]|uniref:hypothetical protein n=1 Tax=Micromonospora sp. NPDC049102 TaxID=3364265 RepID=UPI003713B252